jgi:DNA-binding CsgD family transcriptional regulator
VELGPDATPVRVHRIAVYVVQFDHRGTGNSTRGLKAGHSQERYQLDLEAVIERTGLNNFILFGMTEGTHASTIYASRHPEKVDGLVLWNPQVMAWSVLQQWESVYTDSWDMFQTSLARTFLRQGPSDRQSTTSPGQSFRQNTTQADFLLVARALAASDVEELLPSVRMPTLVMVTRKPAWPGLLDAARTFASLIPKTGLVLFDEPRMEAIYSESGPPAVMPVIEAFVAELPETDPVPGTLGGSPDALSEREVEVLRLVAAGQTNQQIADALVISRNTVRRHVSNVFDKTGVANRTEASVYARDHGLV